MKLQTVHCLGIAMVLSWFFLCLKKKNTRTEWNHHLDFFQVSYNTLLKATDGFSWKHLVGVGSFGSVYKVVLVTPSNRAQIAAVKVFDMLHRGASKSFMAECEMFRNIGHRNIVKIITACSSVDFRGNDFKALVYEFMDNGSLEEWLHPTIGTQNPPKNLSLLERLDVAIDVACALDYLHNHCETPIVHCDLKPSNVLLDSELTGHVSDFGLARFLSKTDIISANQTSSRGSVSYVAPEYEKGSEASTYGDVYSFGILLLEMFTGKKPTNQMFSGKVNLRTFVKMAFFERVIDIADSRLFFQEGNNNTPDKCRARFSSEIEECLSWIFGIGIVCSSKSPRDRMDMSYAVTKLHSIRNILNALHGYGQIGVAGTSNCNCMVCRRKMNEVTAWSLNRLKLLGCPMQKLQNHFF